MPPEEYTPGVLTPGFSCNDCAVEKKEEHNDNDASTRPRTGGSP